MLPASIFWRNADAHEINVRPTIDQKAGVGFYDPETTRFVISPHDVAAGSLAAARDNGIVRCEKINPATVFSVGDTLTFSGDAGVIAGGDPLVVIRPSAAGDQHVFAELNPSGGGGGGGVTLGQVNTQIAALAPRTFSYERGNATPNVLPTLLEIQAIDPAIAALANIPAGSEVFVTLSNEAQEAYRWDGATFTRNSEQTVGTTTAGEASYAVSRTAADPALNTLSAAQLLAAVQAASPEYAGVTALAEGENILVTTDNTSTSFFEVNAVGIAVPVTSFTPTTPVTPDPPTPITFNAHGFDLTTTEGERMPRALYFDGATWSVPTNDGDVTHFAVTAPDANTVGVRTRAEMQGRTYTAITNTGGGVGEFLLFDPVNGLHSSTLTEGLVLGQIGQDATTEFTFDVFPSTAATTGTGTGTDTRSSLRITEFDMAASIATNQIINLNGDTAGVLTYREGYQLHGWPTAAAAFNDGYGNTFWIEWGGQKLLQGDWQPVTANSIRYVGTGLSIVGAEVRVVSQVTETV